MKADKLEEIVRSAYSNGLEIFLHPRCKFAAKRPNELADIARRLIARGSNIHIIGLPSCKPWAIVLMDSDDIVLGVACDSYLREDQLSKYDFIRPIKMTVNNLNRRGH